MFRHSSILWHYTYGAVFTALLAFAGLIAVVAYQMEHSLREQEAKLAQLSEKALLETLSADVDLAAARLNFQFGDHLRRIEALSLRTDTQTALESRNVVAMSELLGPAAQTADVDSILVLDNRGHVIGASSYEADLVAIGATLGSLSFMKDVMLSMMESFPGEKNTFSRLLPVAQTSVFVPSEHENAMSEVIFVPVFDDFGDVIGGLLAQRWFRKKEQILVDLAKINGFEIAVVFDGRVISSAGMTSGVFDGETASLSSYIKSSGGHIVKCGRPIQMFELCALKPTKYLTETQNQLTEIGREEGGKLLKWLIFIGFAALLAFAAVAYLLARQVTRPLTNITRALSGIAGGDFEGDVAGTGRHDEVGDIARSVVLLQRSVKERDALRVRVHEKNRTLKAQEAKLRDQNMLFDAALNNMSHGLCMFDATGKLIVSNRRYGELFGYKYEQVQPGMTASQLEALQDGTEISGYELQGERHTTENGDLLVSTSMLKLPSDRIVLKTNQPLADGGWIEISEDITERQEARDRLAFLARHDPLTHLPNRVEFLEHMEALLSRRRKKGGEFAILCLDLDEFKVVNDSLGHPVGDELLRQVAIRLTEITENDELVVRLGGDEFAVVTELPVDRQSVDDLARCIISQLSQPFQLADHQVTVGTSIGIAFADNDDLVADDLFKQADLALYKAKDDGRKTHRYFEPHMSEAVSERQALLNDLRNAIAHNQLELHYQPQFEMENYKVCGFEALLRWHHPERGMVSPADFIPLAEETGLIVPIGAWVLREACMQAAKWPSDIRVAVNLSPRQLKVAGFGAELVGALASSGLNPRRLELEVTEGVLLQDSEEVLSILRQAKSLGVRVSMDDFGTGYSSLSYLRSFPFDKIKIDQTFVRSMGESEEAVAIVRTVIELAKSLKMTTTAEGVETREMLDILKEIGCTDVQGFYFGRPMPIANALDLIGDQFPSCRQAVIA